MNEASRLFVVADDLGYCERRNFGILECANIGSIDAASLLVTGRCATSAVKLIHDCKVSTFRVGLHFNISEGSGLSPSSEIKTLTNQSSGHFLDKLALRSAAALGNVNSNEVRTELSAQIRSFWNLTGYLPTRVDGHQHVHIISNGICQAFAECLQQFGISKTRLPLDAVAAIDDGTIGVPEQMFRFNQRVNEESKLAKLVFENFNIKHTKAFVGLTLMGPRFSVASLLDAVKIANDVGECELMIHPGYSSDPATCNSSNCGCQGTDGPDIFSLSDDRFHEMTVLKSESFRQLFRHEK